MKKGNSRGATQRRNRQRGQTLVVSAIILLITVLAVFLTFTIGYRTREKTKLQALADSSAYSLAVAEARAFNYYAHSNRAIVAHYVSILSVHSHQSYITWYEQLLKDVSDNYGSSQMKWMLRAACICSKLPCTALTPCGCICKPCPNACQAPGKAQRISRLYKTGMGGYDYVHQQWHQQHNLDQLMSMVGSQGHYYIVTGIRATQRLVDVQLQRMLGTQQMAGSLGKSVDSRITAPPAAGLVNLSYYNSAVTQSPENSDDYHEIMAGTRWPDFLTQRDGLKAGGFWWALYGQAMAIAAGDIIVHSISHDGNSKVLRQDPGSAGGLSSKIHQGGHNATGFGRSLGAGAEDHGKVSNWYVNIACICGAYKSASRRLVGVWSDPKPTRGEHGGDDSNHWYGHGPSSGHENHIHDMGGCSDNHCGIYQGYVRYKLKQESSDPLWNQPRTLAVLTKQNERKVWDFSFSMQLPRDVSLKTIGGPGDSASGNTMAAMAAGLVYFHKPEGAGDNYKEPPNFWNPFWRAKLHPILPKDALKALAAHNASARALGGAGNDALNY